MPLFICLCITLRAMGSNTDDWNSFILRDKIIFLFFKQPQNLAPIHRAHIRLDKVAGY